MDPVKISSKKDFHILFDKLFIGENTLCVRTKEALPVKKTQAKNANAKDAHLLTIQQKPYIRSSRYASIPQE